MSLYQVKGFGVWYVSITHNGQRVRHSTGTSDRRAAQEYHDKLKADLWRAAALGERKKVEHTWAEAAEVWMRAAARSQSDAYRLRWISERWRVMKLADIDADAVDALLDARGNLSAGTTNRYLAQIVAILNVARRRGWIDKLPIIDRRPEPPGRIARITVGQWQALQDALPPHLRQMARFAIATGLRRHNVTHLEWSQIDMERAVAWVEADETKAGNAIGIPLNEDALDVLREQDGAHPVIVFPYRGKAVFKTSTRAWRRACAAAGVSDLTWHDLRHVWAGAHVMAGTSIAALLALGGWKTPRMGLRYAHLSPEHLADVAGNSRLVDAGKKARKA